MTTDTRGQLQQLAARLYCLDTPPEELPVRGYRPDHGPWRPRPAAVLIPVLQHPEPALVLTVRSRVLAHHAGQVAFPGGGRQGNEAFPMHTALRETREEIGLDIDDLEPLGMLDRFDTITGYRVTPVVAGIHGAPRLVPCPDEVDEIFLLPWPMVSDPSGFRRHRVVRGRRCYELVSMAHSRHLIWGATAAILQQFCRLLNPPP